MRVSVVCLGDAFDDRTGDGGCGGAEPSMTSDVL